MGERFEDFGNDVLIRQRENEGEGNDRLDDEQVGALQNIGFAL